MILPAEPREPEAQASDAPSAGLFGALRGRVLRLLRTTEGDREPLRAERARNAARRMRVMLPALCAIHGAHVVAFGFGAEGAEGSRWASLLLAAHGGMLPLVAALAVVVRRSPPESRWLRGLSPSLAAIYIVFGAGSAAVDQLVTPSVTGYLLAGLTIALIFRLSRAQALLTYGLGLVAFVLGQRAFLHGSALLTNNILDGLSISIVGCALSLMLGTAFDRDFANKRTIEAQAAELKASLGALQASNEQLEVALASVRELAEHSASASRAKSEFLANVSHEVRTPMNAVLGFCEILSKDVRDPAQRKRLRGIESASHTLLRLIDDILDLSRMESGVVTLHPEPADLGVIAREVAALLGARSPALALVVEVDPALSEPVLIDAIRVRQVMINLVGNALKFTPSGSVHLRVRAAGEARIEFEVEDTGIGIPEEDHARIFEAFVQQSGTTSRRYGGAGLGLSITRQLVRAMGGEVRLVSAEGRGSTFTVALPRVTVSGARVAQIDGDHPSWVEAHRGSEPGPPAGEGLTIASVAQIEAALTALEGPLRTQQRDCLRLLRTDHIEALVGALREVAKASSATAIERYTRTLARALEDFDVLKITAVLEQYDDMVNDVKKCLSVTL